jgi:4-carboxymuconolactone decarboxylase
MVQLASMFASQTLREYQIMLGAALTVGVTPIEVKEIVYHAVPYVGMAKAFDFIQTTNEVLTERGVKLPLPGESTTTSLVGVGDATLKAATRNTYDPKCTLRTSPRFG